MGLFFKSFVSVLLFVLPLKNCNKKTPLTSGVAGLEILSCYPGRNLSAHLLHTIIQCGFGAKFDRSIAHETRPDNARALPRYGGEAQAMLGCKG